MSQNETKFCQYKKHKEKDSYENGQDFSKNTVKNQCHLLTEMGWHPKAQVADRADNQGSMSPVKGWGLLIKKSRPTRPDKQF